MKLLYYAYYEDIQIKCFDKIFNAPLFYQFLYGNADSGWNYICCHVRRKIYCFRNAGSVIQGEVRYRRQEQHEKCPCTGPVEAVIHANEEGDGPADCKGLQLRICRPLDVHALGSQHIIDGDGNDQQHDDADDGLISCQGQ